MKMLLIVFLFLKLFQPIFCASIQPRHSPNGDATECRPGLYGTNCTLSCGMCFGEGRCNKYNGFCEEGCIAGFAVPYCTERARKLMNMETFLIIALVISVVILAVTGVAIYLIVCRRQVEKKGNSNEAYQTSIEDLEFEYSDEEVEQFFKIIEPTDINKYEMKQYIDKRMSTDQFDYEFKCLPSGNQEKCTVANSNINKTKNRFLSICAFDDSRVKLEKSNIDGSDYINASYIDGYEKRRNYIATQGPMSGTIADFWKMVWQEECGKIVMLTNLVESAKIKCSQYWPSECDGIQMWGTIQVSLFSTIVRSNYVVRTLHLKDMESGAERVVLQFHFVMWPDHGVPACPATLVSFWQLVKNTPTDLTGRLIVHCSAGVGRTGTFIGLDGLMESVKDTDSDVIDVFKYVSIMRANRKNMVQSLVQYVFLHNVVLEAILTHDARLPWSVLERRIYQSALINEATLQEEFNNIAMLNNQHRASNTKGALQECNLEKNRTKDILPHDYNRVYLVTHVEGRNDYIMAYLVPSIYSLDGFICTQLPLESTVVDFWRMVYEYNALTIVSLVQKDHKKDQDILQFLPTEDNDAIESGPFVIRHKEKGSYDGFFTDSVLVLEKQDAPDPTIKSVIHLYTVNEWSEEGTLPDKRGMLQLIEAVQSRQKETSPHPIIVQDLDGTLKCNIYTVVSNCISQMKEDAILNVMLNVREVHSIEPNCISSISEYKFCYEMAKEFIDRTCM